VPRSPSPRRRSEAVAPGTAASPRTDPNGPAHVFILSGRIDPLAEAHRIHRQLDEVPTWIRVVVVPPRRPFDWNALAWVDATTVDGYAWADLPSPPRPDAFDALVVEAQLLLGELLAHLRTNGIRAEGWVTDRRCTGASLPEAIRDLRACRAVTVFDGGRWRALPALAVRLVVRATMARHAIGRGGPRAVVRTIRTTSAPDPGGHRVR
jgi:hypothetical protein